MAIKFKPVYEPRKCCVCDQEFTPTSGAQKACKGCKKQMERDTDRAYRAKRRAEIVCVVCGDHFVPEHANSTVCDKTCKTELIRRNSENARLRRKEAALLAPPIPSELKKRPADMDDVVRVERDEWSLHQVRKHFHLDGREPAKYRAKSLAECEAVQSRNQ